MNVLSATDAQLRAEIARNMDYFQHTLAEHIPSHKGQYAVIKDQQVIGFFDDPLDADIFGSAQAGDRLFSIQEATPVPIERGVYANVVG